MTSNYGGENACIYDKFDIYALEFIIAQYKEKLIKGFFYVLHVSMYIFKT